MIKDMKIEEKYAKVMLMRVYIYLYLSWEMIKEQTKHAIISKQLDKVNVARLIFSQSVLEI